MKIKVLLLFSFFCLILSDRAEEPFIIQWYANGIVVTNGPIPVQEKKYYEKQALDTFEKLGLDVNKYADARAALLNQGEFFKDINVVDINFYQENHMIIHIQSYYPPQKEISIFRDQSMENRQAPNTYKPANTTKEQALKKAREIARSIGRVDLNDESKWRLLGTSFIRKDWMFEFCALINGYPAPEVYRIIITLADNKDLNLVSYHNTMYRCPDVKTEVKVTQEEARKLGDKYLNKYYNTNELDTLEFKTNILEVVVPNYMFTPQYKDALIFTNAPVLAWHTYYKRKTNTFVQTPVHIYVDAANGSMLGGWD